MTRRDLSVEPYEPDLGPTREEIEQGAEPDDAVRFGVDACPGVAEYGHGMNLTTVHAHGCCAAWAEPEAGS